MHAVAPIRESLCYSTLLSDSEHRNIQFKLSESFYILDCPADYTVTVSCLHTWNLVTQLFFIWLPVKLCSDTNRVILFENSTTTCILLTRNCKRWVDAISKKIKELGEMGVPAAFWYIARWNGGGFLVGDSRITDVYRGSSEKLLQRMSLDNASQPAQHMFTKWLDHLRSWMDECWS